MGLFEEALEAAGDGERQMLAFIAALISTKFVVPSRPGAGAQGPAPSILSVDGRPAALAYGSRENIRDEPPQGCVLAEMRGDDLVLALEAQPEARLVLVVESGETRPIYPDMVATMRDFVRSAQMEMGGRPGGRSDGRPEALVLALKEAMARSMEASAAAFAQGDGFQVVVTMHKGQDAAFKYVKGDLERAASEAGFEVSVFLVSEAGSPAADEAPFYRTS